MEGLARSGGAAPLHAADVGRLANLWMGELPMKGFEEHRLHRYKCWLQGPFDMIEMCEAAGFEPIITLREDQSNEDWADLGKRRLFTSFAMSKSDEIAVEYCYGNSTTTWGAQRIADGHPAPYKVHTFELGNEQYNSKFT
jgi:hypothetical protein